MAKRSMRSKSRDSAFAQENVHPLFPSRSRLDAARSRWPIPRPKICEKHPGDEPDPAAIDGRDRRPSVVLALGPAGTGKTYLAIAKAVEALEAGKVQPHRAVASRCGSGRKPGFPAGRSAEKLAPYLRPLYDALTERLGTKRLKAMLAEGIIEIAPVAYMRGRTLNECFVVIDEAQNCTYSQIKMLLTRLGWRSTMVLTGDPDQTDLLPGISGLAISPTSWRDCRIFPSCVWRTATSSAIRWWLPCSLFCNACRNKGADPKVRAFFVALSVSGAQLDHRQPEQKRPAGRHAQRKAVGGRRTFAVTERARGIFEQDAGAGEQQDAVSRPRLRAARPGAAPASDMHLSQSPTGFARRRTRTASKIKPCMSRNDAD